MQYENFGKFLREKREKQIPRVSLNSFELNNNIEPAVLSRIERNMQGISLDVLSKIANGYDILISELFSEYENK